MTKYKYYITFSDGTKGKLSDCEEPLDLKSIGEKKFTLLHNKKEGTRLLINMEHVVTIEENIESE